MVKRCTTRTVLGMLNQAAQKFIFMLEKITMGWGGGTCPLCPPPLWIRHCAGLPLTGVRPKLDSPAYEYAQRKRAGVYTYRSVTYAKKYLAGHTVCVFVIVTVNRVFNILNSHLTILSAARHP